MQLINSPRFFHMTRQIAQLVFVWTPNSVSTQSVHLISRKIASLGMS